jgi:hypothetical protein
LSEARDVIVDECFVLDFVEVESLNIHLGFVLGIFHLVIHSDPSDSLSPEEEAVLLEELLLVFSNILPNVLVDFGDQEEWFRDIIVSSFDGCLLLLLLLNFLFNIRDLLVLYLLQDWALLH